MIFFFIYFFNVKLIKKKFDILVDGMWSPWFSTEPCSKICGDDLIKQRRYCNNPSSAENGHNCWGPNNISHNCEVTAICPGSCI